MQPISGGGIFQSAKVSATRRTTINRSVGAASNPSLTGVPGGDPLAITLWREPSTTGAAMADWLGAIARQAQFDGMEMGWPRRRGSGELGPA